MMTLPQYEFDWSQAWTERLSRSGLRANLDRRGVPSEKFWDSYNDWQEWLRKSNYPGRVLERIKEFARPEYRLLDIGAGGGAFAIPLAEVCASITAVEPSPGQAKRLSEDASRRGINNLRIIPRRWEDVDLEEIGRHDLVMAAYSFEMKDMKEALYKMCRAAGRYCFFIHTAGHDLTGPLHDLLGVLSGPDYIYLYNILYGLGYRPNVEIIPRQYSLPLDLQMKMFSLNPGLDKDQQSALAQFLKDRGCLENRDGQIWVKRRHKDALIWLEKEG